MKAAAITLIYLISILFDVTIIAGTAYLVAVHNWSAAWFLATGLIYYTTDVTYVLSLLEDHNG